MNHPRRPFQRDEGMRSTHQGGVLARDGSLNSGASHASGPGHLIGLSLQGGRESISPSSLLLEWMVGIQMPSLHVYL